MKNEPAFPNETVHYEEPDHDLMDMEKIVTYHRGLTKREYFAGLVLQGLVSMERTIDLIAKTKDFEGTVEVAIKLADALIAELAKEGESE